MNVLNFFGGLFISIGLAIFLFMGGCALLMYQLGNNFGDQIPASFLMSYMILLFAVSGFFVGPGIFLWRKGMRLRAKEKEEAVRKNENDQE